MAITEKDITIYGHGSGRPTAKNLYAYTCKRYAQKAPNGKHKGIAAVRRFKKLNDNGRKKFVEKYKTILGRNHYSQARRGFVYKKYSNGCYYSDCSSSGMATLREIGYNVGGYLLNTAGIYNSSMFETVPVKIKDGHITNPEVLKVGDAILYVGNDSSRPKQIGHVEWVAAVPTSGKSDAEDDKTDKSSAKTETASNGQKKGYTGTFPSLSNGRGWYQYGDGITTLTNYPTQIKRIQKLVNWINNGSIAVDGEYGKQTQAAVEQAQKELHVAVTGKFDAETLAMARVYKK